jgi:hypothetical protein
MALNSNGDIFMLSTEYNSSGTPKEINVSKFTYGIKTATWKVSYTADRIYGVDLKIDADNNVYVLASQFIQGTYNYFTIKYNSEGNYEWGILYYNQDRDNIPVALALSDITDPDIFVAGYSSKGEITTVGYDNDSSPLWNAVVYDCGNNGPDIAAALAIDACDNLYIAGNSNCNNTFRDFKTLKYAATPAPVITPASPVSICEGSSATLNSSAAMSYLWSTGATTDSIVVSTAGMYTVTVTYADGCTAVSKTTNVVVNPLPTASINADKPTICQGESAMLTANTCSGCSYLWNTGETTPVNTVMPLMSTNYTVTVTTAAGCSAASAPLTITVNTVPVVTAAVTGPDTICIGEMTQLSASGATTYNWVPAIGLDDPTSPNPGASPISTTTYTVNGTTAGCSATAFVTVTVFSAPGQPGSINGNISACSGSVQVYSVPEVAGVTYDWALPAGWTAVQNNNSITVTAGQMSGTISVIARNDCGDSPPRTLVVTIIQPPSKPAVINGPASICAGGSMHWYSVDAVAGATSYEWVSPQGWTGTSSSDSIFLTAGDNGGTIFIIANNACGSSSPQMLAVSVEPLPTVEFPMDTIMLLPGQQLTPQIMGDVTSYLWSTNETTMSIAVDSIPMVYTVTVFTSTGCSATASVFVDIKTISTVNKGDPGLLQISPNPASDIINIRCTEAATQLVQLVNLHGQVLVQDETYVPLGEIRQVDIGQAPPGLYFLRIFGKRQYWTVPAVKTD